MSHLYFTEQEHAAIWTECMYKTVKYICLCPSGGRELTDSQRELWRSGSEEAAGQSPAAAAGAEQAGGGVPELCSRPEGALLQCLQTVWHQSEYMHVHTSLMSGQMKWHVTCLDIVHPAALTGWKCGPGASGSGQRLTSCSWGSREGCSKVREANSTLCGVHKLCVWMVSVSSKCSVPLSANTVQSAGYSGCSCMLYICSLNNEKMGKLHCLPHVVLCRSESVLPMLVFAQKRGNTTFYEWRTGTVPTVIDRQLVEEAPPDSISEDTVGFSDDPGLMWHSEIVNC